MRERGNSKLKDGEQRKERKVMKAGGKIQKG